MPSENLGHNPDAGFSERMQARESFNLKAHMAGIAAAPPVPAAITLTVSELRILAQASGFDLIPIDDPAAPKQSEDRSDRISVLELANSSLLQRLNAAESVIRSYRAPKDPATETAPEAEAEVIEASEVSTGDPFWKKDEPAETAS